MEHDSQRVDEQDGGGHGGKQRHLKILTGRVYGTREHSVDQSR